jgi:hypothetical protein
LQNNQQLSNSDSIPPSIPNNVGGVPFPIVPRPYRIPFGTFGCILFLSPACGVCFFLLAVGSKLTYLYFLSLCVFGIFFHILQKTAIHYGWWEYVEAPKKRHPGSSTNKTTTTTSPVMMVSPSSSGLVVQ